MNLRLHIIMLISCVLTPHCFAEMADQSRPWKILGMGGGGTTQQVVISPHDKNIILAESDMSGAYITYDQGGSWRNINLLRGVYSFAFDPVDPNVIYAGTNMLFQSQDQGHTWHILAPNPDTITKMMWVTDDGECHYTSNDPHFTSSWANVSAIGIDPNNTQRLLICLSKQRVLESNDRGRSWNPLPNLDCKNIIAIELGGKQDIIISDKGIHTRTPTVWQLRPGPEQLAIREASAFVTKKEHVIYATTPVSWENNIMQGGIYVSDDLGVTWQNCIAAFSGSEYHFKSESEWRYTQQFKALAVDPANPDRCYAGFRGLRNNNGMHMSGIAVTEDRGKHWDFVHIETNEKNANMETSYVEDRAPDSYPNLWFDDPYDLDCAAGGEFCIAADLFRIYSTTNKGKTWQQVNSRKMGDNLWQSSGINLTTCYGVHWDPFDQEHMYISYTDMGLHQSWDGGKSWQGASTGMPNRWRNTAYWIAIDPHKQGQLWCASSATHDLPRPRMFRNRHTDTYKGGVCKSQDGGNTWQVTSNGLPTMAVTHILLDPDSPAGNRRLHITGFGHGIYTSEDDGMTWHKTSNGIHGEKPLCWRLTRNQNGTLYAIVARRSEKGEIGDNRDGALYMSTDKAASWQAMTLPENTNGPTDLAVNPQNPNHLYLSLWGRYKPSGDVGGGIYHSTDGGKHWEQLFSGDQHVYSITIDKHNPQRMFAAGYESSIYRSLDAGKNWERIKGFNFTAAHRVFIDPKDPEMIYVTTFGGSVWHGPAAGSTQANPDISTPLPWLEQKSSQH